MRKIPMVFNENAKGTELRTNPPVFFHSMKPRGHRVAMGVRAPYTTHYCLYALPFCLTSSYPFTFHTRLLTFFFSTFFSFFFLSFGFL